MEQCVFGVSSAFLANVHCFWRLKQMIGVGQLQPAAEGMKLT